MKKILLPLVFLLLLVLVAVYFLLIRKPPTDSSSTAAVSTGTSTSGQSSPKTVFDLLSTGRPQKCTFVFVQEDFRGEGTVYTDGKKVRTVVSSNLSGQVMETHMLLLDDTSYIWTTGNSLGFKTKVDPDAKSDQPESDTSEPVQTNYDLNQQYDYRCSPWAADDQLFTLPSGIEFSDFGVTAPAPSGTSLSPGTGDCSACDYLSGQTKVQCLTALNCPI